MVVRLNGVLFSENVLETKFVLLQMVRHFCMLIISSFNGKVIHFLQCIEFKIKTLLPCLVTDFFFNI